MKLSKINYFLNSKSLKEKKSFIENCVFLFPSLYWNTLSFDRLSSNINLFNPIGEGGAQCVLTSDGYFSMKKGSGTGMNEISNESIKPR